MKLSKHKNSRFLKSISAVICLVLAMALSGCSNAAFIGNSYKIGNNITIEFQLMNSNQTQEIDLKAGDTVRFDVTKESGKINVAFGIRNSSPDYEGNDLESTSFTVTVHTSGRYVLSVTGENAKGSVRLTKSEQK